MNKKLWQSLALLSCLAFSAFAIGEPIAGRGESLRLESKRLDETREIIVRLPELYDQAQGVAYPVLYLLDGDAQLSHTAGTLKYLVDMREMPDLIVVAVANTDRNRDLTPTVIEGMPNSGGAHHFLDFLTTELRTFIDQRYRTNGYNLLAGHSFGGLFTVYSLLEAPAAFNARFAFSPSLRFMGEALTKQAMEPSPDSFGNSFLYMNVGGENEAMVNAFRSWQAVFENQPSDNFTFVSREYPDETHFTTPIIGQFDSFRQVFNGWKLNLSISRNGPEAIADFYQTLSARVGYEVVPDEKAVTSAAFEIMYVLRDLDKALAVLDFNAGLHPNSPDIYYAMADMLERQNNLEQAIARMEKAIALLPEDDQRQADYKRRLQTLNEKVMP